MKAGVTLKFEASDMIFYTLLVMHGWLVVVVLVDLQKLQK